MSRSSSEVGRDLPHFQEHLVPFSVEGQEARVHRLPVLSDNMPKLSSGLTRGVNKTAVVYIGLVSVAAIGATLWVANNAFSANDHEKKKVTFEEVTVPEKPQLRLPPPEVDQVVARAEPRELPPMPAMAQPAAPQNDDLMQRRMASENNLVAASEKGKKNPLFEDEFSAVKRGAGIKGDLHHDGE